MDSSSLQLVLYRAFTETESVSSFLSTAVDGLNSAGTDRFALEISYKNGIEVRAGNFAEVSNQFVLGSMDLFSGVLWSSHDSITPDFFDSFSMLIAKRIIEHTRYYDRASETVMRVLGITFHDVRNTLGSISGISQLLEMDAADKPEVINGIHDIIGIISKYDETATTTMRLLRGQEIRYNHDEYSLTDLCNSVLKRSARVYQLSSIVLVSSIQDEIVCVGDEVYLKELFMELLTNAANAIEGTAGTITVSVAEQGGIVEISVGQSGSPVLPEVQEYIFLPFFTTKEKGRGMGLTRIARYLKDWGGKIELLPTPDQPVRFVVTLPTTLP